MFFERKPEHSREAYRKAERERQEAYQAKGGVSFIADNPWEAFDKLDRRRAKADKKLEELYATGQEEAIELNEEYNRLKEEVDLAFKKLATFQKEKLGIKDEGES